MQVKGAGFGGTSSSNETLSIRQAQKIKDELYKILNDCIGRIDGTNADFLGILSVNWADENAVEYGKAHNKRMEVLLRTIKENYKKFIDVLDNICSAYAQAGGMTSHLQTGTTTGNLRNYSLSNKMKINNHFGDGDEFGFKDVNESSEKITSAFSDILKKYLCKAALDTVNQLKAVNAFGNTRVQLTLAQSAGEIVNIITATIKELKKLLDTKLDETKSSYMNIGISAEAAAKISAN